MIKGNSKLWNAKIGLEIHAQITGGLPLHYIDATKVDTNNIHVLHCLISHRRRVNDQFSCSCSCSCSCVLL
jgi:hypothetical protein